jgi:hypothetical protein
MDGPNRKVGRILNTVFQMHKMQLHLPREKLSGEDKAIKEKRKDLHQEIKQGNRERKSSFCGWLHEKAGAKK